MKRTVQLTGALAGTLAIVVAGCAGGGSSSSALPGSVVQSVGTGTAKFTITIPAKSSSAAHRVSPDYVSSNTGSVSFAVNGGAPTVIALTPGTSTCPGSTPPYTCTASASVPAGSSQSIAVATYQSSTGSGTPLSMNTITQAITANTENDITVTLNGVATAISLALSKSQVFVGNSATVVPTWNATDASGATIIGPGTVEDVNGNAVSPTLADSDGTGATVLTGSAGAGWSVAYNGTDAVSPTFTLSASGFTSATQTLTINSVVNGDFETGVVSPWYVCYANHDPVGPIDASPAAYTAGDPTPGGTTATPSPTPKATTNPDTNTVTAVATTGPAVAPHGGTYDLQVGHSDIVDRGKGNIGFCQDVAVPSSNPMLTMYVFEGGNHPSLYNEDAEASIYASGSFTTSGPGKAGTFSTAAAPAMHLFLENNCYDNLLTTITINGTAGTCTPGTGPAAHGGSWHKKGPYNLSTYAGTTVTLFAGIMGSSTSTTFYGYSYFDDVVLTKN